LFEREQVLSIWSDPLADLEVRGENLAEKSAPDDSPIEPLSQAKTLDIVHASATSSVRRRGRRPTHDWASFHAEIARRVGNDPDGFPVVQADLERDMADWCLKEWGEGNCPSESTIREQVARYYRRK
jgi:hypothetical protein